MDQLHNGVFITTLSKRVAALLQDVTDEEAPPLGKFNRPLTNQEKYLTETLESASEVITACNQLEFALTYLSGYRNRLTSRGELISRADYIAYQLENLYLRLEFPPRKVDSLLR